MTGDPTVVALFHAAADAGYDKAALEAASPRVLELPFDSERKRMTTLHRRDGGAIAYTKGAPESMLPRCTTQARAEATLPLARDTLLGAAARMAAELGLTLALASAVFVAVEAEKWLVRRGLLYAAQNIGHTRSPEAAGEE